MIWGPLEPYVLYIKIAAVAIVLSGATYLGWTARGWKCDAALTATAVQAVKDVEEEVGDFKRKAALEEGFRNGQRDRFTAENGTLKQRNAALEEEIKNANLNNVTPRAGESLRDDEPFNVAFLREWNAPILALSSVGGGPQDGFELLGADTRAVRATREDVLQHHRKIVGLYGDCKVKQNYVIEFDHKYRPLMGDK